MLRWLRTSSSCWFWILPLFVGSAAAVDLGAIREVPAYRQAVELATEGAYPEAEELFRKLLEGREDHPLLLYMVGICQFFQGDLSDAVTSLSKSLEAGAPFPESYYWTARALLEAGDRRRAAEAVGTGLKVFPGNELLKTLSPLLGDE